MPIIASELKLYKSLVIGDAGTNGGRMSANQATSGAASNVFPTVSESERTAGVTRYRKVFAKVANDADLTLFNARVFLDKNTPGGDRISFFPGTQTNVQSALTGSERQYGGGKLNSNASAGASSVAVLVEAAAAIVFVNGDKIRISDRATMGGAGNEEFVTINGTITFAGDVATIPITPNLSNSYLAADTRVMSVYEPGDVKGTITNLVVTSAGDGDLNIDNILPDHIGTVEQTWTLTFTSATAYNIVGDTVGSQGTGSTGGGASPNNTSFSKPYFVIQSAGFTGTWQSGDTIVFQTHPAAVPIWLKQVVPASTATQANNTATLVMDGETVG